jgi:high-affinity iron transporter
MVETFIIALREGVEAALVIAIALAYLRKIGREDLHKVVYRALGSALAASLLGAYLFQRLEWNEEAFEGWTLLASAVFVFTMVVWMWRHGRHLKAEMEAKLGEISRRGAGAGIGVFLFVFLMVFREGVETVLLLAAVNFTSDSILEAGGLLLGFGLAIAFGVTFVRGTVRIDLRRFFRITSMILLVVAVQLLITGLHELSEAGVLPSSEREMALIGPIVRNDVFFFVTVLALAAWMVLLEWRRRKDAPALAGEGAARRKAAWSARQERFWMTGVSAACVVFILLITAEFIYAKSNTELSPARPLQAVSGQIRIPVDAVSDGNLHRFGFQASDRIVRFIVIQRPDRSLATALDACLICGDHGYYQKGPNVICKNCASAIFIPSIGAAGGCNPIPIASLIEGSELVIDAAELTGGAKHFRR